MYVIFISWVWKWLFISQVWKWADLQCLCRQTCHLFCKTVRGSSGKWQYVPNTWIMLFIHRSVNMSKRWLLLSQLYKKRQKHKGAYPQFIPNSGVKFWNLHLLYPALSLLQVTKILYVETGSCFLFGDVLVPPSAVNLCPQESLSNRKPRQFLSCCEYHRLSGHI